MNLISAAGRLLSLEHSIIQLEAGRCVHASHKRMRCQACFDACPAAALKGSPVPTLDSERCINCLACLPVCPTGAFSAEDESLDLFTTADRLRSKSIELVCGRHPSPNTVFAEDAVPVQLSGCLAGLSASSFLALRALGVERIGLRGDACGECGLKPLTVQIRRQLRIAADHLEGAGLEAGIAWIDEVENRTTTKKPAANIHSRMISRRDLLRLKTEPVLNPFIANLKNPLPASANRPSRERIRIAYSIQRLNPPAEGESPWPAEELGYARVRVSEACTACGVCARTCPTAALIFQKQDDQSFVLAFQPRFCIGCEACAAVCAPGAVSVQHSPGFQEVFGRTQPDLLASGALTRCKRCRTQIAKREGVELCPLCEFRKKNPLGGVPPPGIQAIIDIKISDRKNDPSHRSK